jgi:hypothetical protein
MTPTPGRPWCTALVLTTEHSRLGAESFLVVADAQGNSRLTL